MKHYFLVRWPTGQNSIDRMAHTNTMHVAALTAFGHHEKEMLFADLGTRRPTQKVISNAQFYSPLKMPVRVYPEQGVDSKRHKR